MHQRPKTYCFTELQSDLSNRDLDRLVNVKAAPAGRRTYRNGGRPLSPEKQRTVLLAIREAAAAGNSPEQIAAVLDVPAELVRDYLSEVMP